MSGADKVDEKGDGTHVAGIAAANAGEVRGTAPHAQIAAMKVASDTDDSISDSTVLAALDDAAAFDPDVVNMSLGSSGGFSAAASSTYSDAFSALRAKGAVLSASEGNSYSSAAQDSNRQGCLGEGLRVHRRFRLRAYGRREPRYRGTASIGKAAFSDCPKLADIDFRGDLNRLASIGASAFAPNSNLTSVDLPDSVASVGEGAFADNDRLTSVFLGASMTGSFADAFKGSDRIEKVAVSDSNPAYAVEGSVLYRMLDDGLHLIFSPSSNEFSESGYDVSDAKVLSAHLKAYKPLEGRFAFDAAPQPSRWSTMPRRMRWAPSRASGPRISAGPTCSEARRRCPKKRSTGYRRRFRPTELQRGVSG